jgi:hypothetical protein|tara:strand:- start:565 stop:1203 length:639 start_codon:yes stop_codon:yes gene_type:complete
MATVQAKGQGVNANIPQGGYYTVSINTSGFLDTETVNGGRVSPCTAQDFATKPTTLAQSLLVSRGNLRYRRMLDNLQTRSNIRLVNLVNTYAADAGNNPITSLAFGLVFENDSWVPAKGTDIDSDAYTTKILWIKDKVGEALNSTWTETMDVYNPTSGVGLTSTQNVTASAVHGTPATIVSAITVAEVAGFRSNVASEVAGDNASLHTNDTE